METQFLAMFNSLVIHTKDVMKVIATLPENKYPASESYRKILRDRVQLQ